MLPCANGGGDFHYLDQDKLQILEPAFDVDPADGMTQGM